MRRAFLSSAVDEQKGGVYLSRSEDVWRQVEADAMAVARRLNIRLINLRWHDDMVDAQE